MELDARDRPADTGPVFLLALKVASRFPCLTDGSLLPRRWAAWRRILSFPLGSAGRKVAADVSRKLVFYSPNWDPFENERDCVKITVEQHV